MTAILVTGATGTVGHAVARRLAAEGASVKALVRSPERARKLLPDRVEAVEGDITAAGSVRRAMDGCTVVYHAAGLPEQWLRDPGEFERVNLGGTRNVVEAALEAGVERLVYTSTIDVFAAEPGVPFNESTLDSQPRPTVYERSKQEADRFVATAIERGLPAVLIHPAAVYGPAPQLTRPINDLLVRLAKRKVPTLLPGGLPLVLADDVADGQLRAAGRAPVGARYILSGSFQALQEVARAVAELVPGARVPPVMPMWVGWTIATIGEPIARLTKRPPIVQRGDLHFLAWRPHPSAERARRELGWTPTPFADGLARTIEHFRRQGWI